MELKDKENVHSEILESMSQGNVSSFASMHLNYKDKDSNIERKIGVYAVHLVFRYRLPKDYQSYTGYRIDRSLIERWPSEADLVIFEGRSRTALRLAESEIVRYTKDDIYELALSEDVWGSR
ncbi:hypothetical protein M0802_008107 [Mischocyttarus mexicanus]|nr:hypothetical protein M0802_008107 [Mischocyttarus mexicanus]